MNGFVPSWVRSCGVARCGAFGATGIATGIATARHSMPQHATACQSGLAPACYEHAGPSRHRPEAVWSEMQGQAAAPRRDGAVMALFTYTVASGVFRAALDRSSMIVYFSNCPA